MNIGGPLLGLVAFLAAVVVLLGVVAIGATGVKVVRDWRESRALVGGVEEELRRAAGLADDAEDHLRHAANLQQAIEDWEDGHGRQE